MTQVHRPCVQDSLETLPEDYSLNFQPNGRDRQQDFDFPLQALSSSLRFVPSLTAENHGGLFRRSKKSQGPQLVETQKAKEGELVVPYEKYVLENGLTLIIHEDHSNPKVRVDVTYKVGSRNEVPGFTGFAHLYEHMMFEGSRHLDSWEIPKLVREMGGSNNGTTDQDLTHYYETIPSHELETILWAEADRMATVLDAVDQDRFETQREAVKSEKLQRVDNQPNGRAPQVLAQTLYPQGHPYSWVTIGHVEDLDRVQLSSVHDFYYQWYGPNNAILTISGDVDVTQTLAWIEKYFGGIPRGPQVDTQDPQPVELDQSRYVTYEDPYLTEPQVSLVYPTVERFHPDEAALDMLKAILTSGKDSLFYHNFELSQMAQSYGSSHNCKLLAGKFEFSFRPADGYSLADMEKRLDETLAEFEQGGFEESVLQRHVAAYKFDFIYGIETVEEKADTLRKYESILGDPNYIQQDLQRYEDVTVEDVWRVYETYIKGKPRVVLSMVSQGQTEMAVRADNFTVPAPAEPLDSLPYDKFRRKKLKDDFDRSLRPESLEPAEIKLPEPWRVTLDSGVEIMGSEVSEIPVVKVQFSFQAGEVYASQDDLFAPSFLAILLSHSSAGYTSEELSAKLQSLGSGISFSAGRTGFTVTVTSLSENLDETLTIAKDLMFNPIFDEPAFERRHRSKMQGLEAVREDPGAITNRVFNRVVYEESHFLSLSHSQFIDSLESLTREDVIAFYNQIFLKQGVKVFVAGDVTQEEIVRKLGYLGDWQGSSVEPPLSLPNTPDATKIYLVDIPGAAQSRIRMGYRTNVDWDPVGQSTVIHVMNKPLGSGSSGRLFKTLRHEHKFTYGASSSFSFGDEGGVFLASTDVGTEVTHLAVQEMLGEIQTYQQEGPTQEELEATIQSDTQGKFLKYESLDATMDYVVDLYTDDLPEDFIQENIAFVSALTLADVQQEAKRSLQPDHMAIVVTGDRSQIEEGLRSLGYEVVILDNEGNVVE